MTYKYVEKIFNWSGVHHSEMTCYKIHTLVADERRPSLLIFWKIQITQLNLTSLFDEFSRLTNFVCIISVNFNLFFNLQPHFTQVFSLTDCLQWIQTAPDFSGYFCLLFEKTEWLCLEVSQYNSVLRWQNHIFRVLHLPVLKRWRKSVESYILSSG